MQSIASAMQQPGAGGEVAPTLTPEELEAQRERERELEEQRIQRLNMLGESLAKTRSEAIAARQNSGIEEEWLEDEEFYQGIDDANRGEHRSAWRKKPAGAAVESGGTPGATRSTVFPNITRPYVDAAAARIADMLLPTDDRAWGIRPTPLPEAIDAAKGKYSPALLKDVAAKFPSSMPGHQELVKKELAIATEAALKVIAEAKAKAEKAQTRIEDWHVECQFHSHVRLVIEDAARVGAGILKGPVPVKKNRKVWDMAARTVRVAGELKPASKWIDYWNFFPDHACGENIHDGSYTWERDFLTKRQLRELKERPGYIAAQIDECLAEGAQRAIAEEKPGDGKYLREASGSDKERFEIWYFHGTAEREDLEAAGEDVSDIADPHIPVLIEMVNNRVIKATFNPIDTGDFPYDVMVWQRRSGHWAGIGVARQIRTPQRIVTAATRNLMDNAGLAAGPMLVFRQGVIYGADGNNSIRPRKVWYIQQDAEEMVDATKAIGVIKVDMLVTELMEIIQFGLKLAEDVTGLPMLLQGQQGQAPDTVGGMQMLNNNASAVLRRLARLFDDRVTEPHVRRYYTWLLIYGEDDEKGDYCIDARGSSALVERDLQNQAVLQMSSIVTNPLFGLDPKKWAQEYLKSQRLDAKRFEYDDEHWQQLVTNLSKGKEDPRLAVAQLRAELEAKLQAAEQAFEESENAKDRALEAWLAELERQGTKEVTLDTLKTKLADTVIKTGTQRALSPRDDRRQPAGKPPTEPAGRARRGEAYQH